ncbi:hypothetical protein [uncultured Oscillibacter sp.]|uniref:hypothetical protein n=1 Tax=uncultured Oscillibacter sp. TaxID=876091 RepID=UPI00263A0EA8|nr:hypothetical protein [uncultured Oscillibacter sp.]
MEKIILIRGSSTNEVNEYLEKGWSVKMMKTVNDATTNRFYAYVVLEKEDE